MSHDPSLIEAELRQLRAAGLDASLLDRLDACSEGTWTALTPEEIRYERQLVSIAPARLPAALMASLEATLREVPYPGDETIIRFPVKTETTHRRYPRGRWAAAAAVALTGAVTALLIPMGHSPEQTAGAPPPSFHNNPAATGGGFIPAEFNRGLSEADDQGVVWNAQRQPHRVVRVVYKDLLTLKDASGQTYQVEQPRVEYILVPAKTD